jgi:sialate O-acetylesterase
MHLLELPQPLPRPHLASCLSSCRHRWPLVGFKGVKGLINLAGLLLAAWSPAQEAGLRLAPIFTDHMIVQQERPIVVCGTATAGEEVSVQFAGQAAKTRALADGTWRVTLPALKADGQAHTLLAKSKTSVELNDVWLGEVWVCGGQSNMGRPIEEADAKDANRPQLRLFNSSGETPRRAGMDDVTGWVVCSPASVLKSGDGEGAKRRGFSEVAYHFGLKLHQTLKVPMGLIQVNCGGSTAKDWTPAPADVLGKFPFDARIQGITHKHGLLYHVRMPGLVSFPVRGVIWYQGEDDGRNRAYGQDLKALIEAWRGAWGQPDLPFYFAQIAPTTYAGGMLNVWEGQRWVMEHVPHTGLAPSNDIYEDTNNPGFRQRDDPKLGWPIVGGSNPHPTGRPRVAGRLAAIALAQTYGQTNAAVFGPMYQAHEFKDGKTVVRFQHTGAGLTTHDGRPPNWFELSDGTREGSLLRYVKAQARLVDASTVEVSAPEVKQPKFVRFGWHALARFNLANKDGLPAVSFRTDNEP